MCLKQLLLRYQKQGTYQVGINLDEQVTWFHGVAFFERYPVDAAFKAIEAIINCGCKLLLYSVNNITTGTDSQGEVTVRIEKDSRIVNGTGADTDIVIASAKAYLNAMNKMKVDLDRAHPQSSQQPI